jgi:ABC-type transport system involved in multi-copper enzyme maturation permease subunit
MNLLEQLWAIARNTAIECMRQPLVLAVLVAGTLLIILSIPFSGFTLMDDQRMFVDIALSTIFVCGTLLAAFLATNALSREIDNRTALTVISKPVGRPAFVWGKFLGVAAALTACTLFLSFVFMLVEVHGTMPTVSTPYHYPVLTIGLIAMAATLGAATWTNYFYGWSFPAAMLGFGVPLLGLAYLLSLLFAKDWTPVLPMVQFKGTLWIAIGMMLLGLWVLASIAVAVSTRFGQVVTLGITFGAFVLGLMSDWLIARNIRDLGGMLDRLAQDGNAGSALDANHAKLALLKASYAVLPNSQVFWLSDAIQQKKDIPLAYLMPSMAYGIAMIVAVLCVAVAMFQRREVG